jgi:hypothetical protein
MVQIQQTQRSPFEDFRKIYRGSFDHVSKAGDVYSEEAFEVYKDERDLSHHFDSQTLSRVASGELLKIRVLYSFSAHWMPMKVVIEKNLGPFITKEEFLIDDKRGVLNYSFKTNGNEFSFERSLPPKFHINTPAACCSMTFLLSKKFDTTAKNFYTLFSSESIWEISNKEAPLSQRSAVLERISSTSENMTIKKQSLEGLTYKLYDQEDLKRKEQDKTGDFILPFLKVFTSKHVAIPYQIYAINGDHIDINFLNALDNDF